MPERVEPSNGTGSWKTPAMLLVLAVIGRIVLSEFTAYTSDDAFISYRYASNIASGKGFAYNEGESVQGTSTPLYTLILAGAAFVIGPLSIPFVSKMLAVLADGLTLLIVWRILSGIPALARYAAVALFALYPKILLIGISGMEASLVVLMMMGMTLSLIQDRQGVALVLAALLVLCRFDAILWVMILIVWFLVIGGRIKGQYIILPCCIVLLWIVVAISLFDSWIPHPVVAKQVSWHHLFPAFDPVRVLSGYLPFQGLSGFPGIIRYPAMILLLVPVFAEVMGVFSKKRRFLQIFPVFFVLYNLAFSFGRVVMADWYYLPGYVAYAVTIGLFVERMMTLFSTRQGAGLEPLIRYGGTALLIIFVMLGALRWRDNPGGLFLRQNKQLGVWLKQNAPPGSHVMLEPIGYVGWESGLRVYDYIGLVSPPVVESRKTYPDSDVWFLNFVQEHTPEYIVLRNWEVPRNMLFHGHGDGIFIDESDRAWFEEHYKRVDWNPRAGDVDSVYLVLYEYQQPIRENLARR